MLAEMDKIDDTKVKTKDMINKRRKLEDQISSQENKIKRVKDELRKMKAMWVWLIWFILIFYCNYGCDDVDYLQDTL